VPFEKQKADVPRTIVYDRPIRIAEAEQTLRREFGDAGPIGATRPDAVATRPGDDFASKLVKYIPAEALAFVALISSFSDITEPQVITIVAVGLAGQMLWLRRQGAKLPPADRPTWRQYILSAIAYAAWVLGTSPAVSAVFGVDRTTATITMASVAYLLPLIDDPTHEWLDPKPAEHVLIR
jgi:hypothetical protein